MKVLLDDFLELHTQNKLKLLTTLYTNNTMSYKMLTDATLISYRGVASLIEEINSDIQGLGIIEKDDFGLELIYNKDVNISHMYRAISKHSTTLLCLQFLLMNDKGASFFEFARQIYLTKSTAYRVRKKCCEYLKSIGLDVNDNTVVGEEYRIRFLIALLHHKFGVDCYEMDEQSKYAIRRFILSTNSTIDYSCLEQCEMEYGYFEYLVMLAWKRGHYQVSNMLSEHFNRYKTVFVYNEMKIALKKTLEKDLNISLTEDDYDYLYLVYACTSSCIFADQWTEEKINYVQNIIFQDPVFEDLLQRLGKIFPPEMMESHALKGTLVYFCKKCIMGLHCIIPNKDFSVQRNRGIVNDWIFKRLYEVFSEWSSANSMTYPIENNHLAYLAVQMEFILKQFIPPIKIYIICDLHAELQVMMLFLKHMYSLNRIQPIPVLVNAQSKNLLYSQHGSIFIVDRKFIHVVDALDLTDNDNSIVPVSIELTEQELQQIDKTIRVKENEQLLKFISQGQKHCTNEESSLERGLQ